MPSQKHYGFLQNFVHYEIDVDDGKGNVSIFSNVDDGKGKKKLWKRAWLVNEWLIGLTILPDLLMNGALALIFSHHIILDNYKILRHRNEKIQYSDFKVFISMSNQFRTFYKQLIYGNLQRLNPVNTWGTLHIQMKTALHHTLQVRVHVLHRWIPFPMTTYFN